MEINPSTVNIYIYNYTLYGIGNWKIKTIRKNTCDSAKWLYKLGRSAGSLGDTSMPPLIFGLSVCLQVSARGGGKGKKWLGLADKVWREQSLRSAYASDSETLFYTFGFKNRDF